MPEPQSSLAGLRAEIDRIDDSIHDAIMRRAELVGRIRAAKPAGLPTTRPAREAQILRRLLERHEGQFPRRTLVQMWQEMIDAFTFLQGSLRIAAPPGTERLVRDQYGVLAETTWENDTDTLLAHAAGGDVLAVLPWPEAGQDWWLRLAAMPGRPMVFACLPFVAVPGGPRAVSIGRAPFEPSGHDRSWVVAPAGRETPFASAVPIAWGQGQVLLEVDRFIAPDDPGLTGLALLGCFPTPYSLDAIRS